MPPKKRLGELLIDAGVVDEEQLKAALGHQRQWGGRLGRVLVQLQFLTEERLSQALAFQLQLQRIDLDKTEIAADVLRRVPVELAERHRAIPVRVDEHPRPTLFVAMTDPTSFEAIDALQFKSGLTVVPLLATDSSIDRALCRFYNVAPIAAVRAPTQPARPAGPASTSDLITLNRGDDNEAPSAPPTSSPPRSRPSRPEVVAWNERFLAGENAAPPQRAPPRGATEAVARSSSGAGSVVAFLLVVIVIGGMGAAFWRWRSMPREKETDVLTMPRLRDAPPCFVNDDTQQFRYLRGLDLVVVDRIEEVPPLYRRTAECLPVP